MMSNTKITIKYEEKIDWKQKPEFTSWQSKSLQKITKDKNKQKRIQKKK